MNSELGLLVLHWVLPLGSSQAAIRPGYHKAPEIKAHNLMDSETQDNNEEQSPNGILWIQLDQMWLSYSHAFQLHE